jgi:hypothetical protein
MKSDKELTVELVSTIISANPKIKYQDGTVTEKINYSVTPKDIDYLLSHYYELISKLGAEDSESK